MDDEIVKAREMATNAQRTADTAVAAISGHEILCAERYKNIETRLLAFPRLFEKIDSLATVVYMGMGIAVAIPVIVEMLRYLKP